MSVKQMGLVFEYDLPHNEAWVLMAYADRANHEGEDIFPSDGRIAWKTGYTIRQIQRIKKLLLDKKYMEIVQAKGGRPLHMRIVEANIPRKAEYDPDVYYRSDKMSDLESDKMSDPESDKMSDHYDIAVSDHYDIAVSDDPLFNHPITMEMIVGTWPVVLDALETIITPDLFRLHVLTSRPRSYDDESSSLVVQVNTEYSVEMVDKLLAAKFAHVIKMLLGEVVTVEGYFEDGQA